MKNYIKHLLSKPLKLLWLLAATVFCIVCFFEIVSNKEEMVYESSWIAFYGMLTIIGLILFVSHFHAYKEYEDGI